jgi:hypothetical protein
MFRYSKPIALKISNRKALVELVIIFKNLFPFIDCLKPANNCVSKLKNIEQNFFPIEKALEA